MHSLQTELSVNLIVDSIGCYKTKMEKGSPMLEWILILLIIAAVASLLGFRGVAGLSAGIARILIFVVLVVLLISLLTGIIIVA